MRQALTGLSHFQVSSWNLQSVLDKVHVLWGSGSSIYLIVLCISQYCCWITMTYSSVALCTDSGTKWEDRKLLDNGIHVKASGFNSHQLAGKKRKNTHTHKVFYLYISWFIFKNSNVVWQYAQGNKNPNKRKANRLIIVLLLHRIQTSDHL